ncbi:MAG: glutamate 5-kinase [Clostridiales bacterium]|nr:glutamate 5-kinase [Clostridiales bacterium]
METAKAKKRIVVKVGTSTLTHEGGKLNFRSFDRLSRVLADIHNTGYDIILVSSGAIAVGAGKLLMKEKPQELSLKQAAAAVGQCELMHLYDKFFGEYGQIVAQILLTGDDVQSPEIKQNLINTFNALLNLGIIPIVNENDSVSYAEIETHTEEHKIFGDNDTLSAVVAVLCKAEKLVLLSDIDGLFDENPCDNPDACLIREVREIDEKIKAIAGGAGSSRGTGGMITKLQAAEMAMNNGIDMIIANGNHPELLYDIVDGRPVGTLFAGKAEV